MFNLKWISSDNSNNSNYNNDDSNSSCHLLSSYYVSGSAKNALFVLTYWTFTISPGDGSYYYGWVYRRGKWSSEQLKHLSKATQ